MAQVTITVNGVTVSCDVSEVAAVTAALAGSGLAGRSNDDDDGGPRPGERRRENSTNATQSARAEEFRRIRAQHTTKTVREVAGAKLPRDSRRRDATGGAQ